MVLSGGFAPPAILRGVCGAALVLACSATSGQNCTFRTAGGPINFPVLDQSMPVTVAAFTTVVVRCTPTAVSPAWSFSGANGNAPLRMKHSTLNEYIPYTILPVFMGASGSNETWRITSTVLGVNYENATIGSYSDVLSATVLP